MSDFSVIEKAEAYLNIHLTHSGPPGSPEPVGPFVTISRESGTGGTHFANLLALRLPIGDSGQPWSVYSGNLIEEMLRTNNLPTQLARYLPEDRIHAFDASVGELVGLHPDLWTLVEKTNELIRRLARAGHAILLGRGGAFATTGLRHAVHLRLVASEAYRAACTARWLSLDPESAAVHNRMRDAARRRYVRSTFGANISDPTAYDLVIDVERVAPAEALELVSNLVRHRETLRTAELRARERAHAPAAEPLAPSA